MTDEQQSAFKPLWHLMSRENVRINTLATAIEENGIQGWDRFGRFKTFKADSKDPDHVKRFNMVLNGLAAQYEFEEMPHGGGRSPLDEAEDFAGSGHPFEYGWLVPPDFSAIVAAAEGHPTEPKQKSKREETSDLNILAVLLEVLLPKAGYKSEAALINELLTLGYGDYAGISERNLEKRFAAAKKSLLQ